MAMSGKPFQAFGQDHRAHIDTHLAFMGTNMARNNPMVFRRVNRKYIRTHCFDGTRTS